MAGIWENCKQKCIIIKMKQRDDGVIETDVRLEEYLHKCKIYKWMNEGIKERKQQKCRT